MRKAAMNRRATLVSLGVAVAAALPLALFAADAPDLKQSPTETKMESVRYCGDA
jgi:hypothetical protein